MQNTDLVILLLSRSTNPLVNTLWYDTSGPLMEPLHGLIAGMCAVLQPGSALSTWGQ